MKRGKQATVGGDGHLEAALDRLYASELEDFVTLRKQIVAELRAAGEKETAARVARSGKPPVTAWALDRVARESPELLRAAVQAREVAERAQREHDADRLRESLRAFRAKTAAVVGAARDLLATRGQSASAAQLRRMGETLQAAIADLSGAGAALEKGRLDRDVPFEEPMAGVEEPVARPAHGAGRTAREPDRAAIAQAARQAERQQARLDAAERELVDLGASLATAQAEARRAERAALHAREDADRLRAHATALEGKQAKAREALRSLKGPAATPISR